MKCKILECNNDANLPYPACSETHGTSLRMRKDNIKNAFDADMDRIINARSLYSVTECAYYIGL